MAESSTGQKTEKPTPRRLQEARRKGQIPRSPDLVGWFAVLVATFIVPYMVRRLGAALQDYFLRIEEAIIADDLGRAMVRPIDLLASTSLVLIPFLFFLVLVTAGGLIAQGGITLSLEPLKPKKERISPKAGIKRMFSSQSLVDTAKALFRLVALVVLVSQIMVSQVSDLVAGVARPRAVIGDEVAASLLLLVRLAAFLGVIVGIADYAYQRWKVGKQLRMSKEEIKREQRNTDGDPMLRSRRRSLHQKVSQNKMLSAVGEASVVVVNPTHYAVALAYEAGGVPKVVAKGYDDLAFRIRERAFENEVPVVECRPLARILHDLLDVGAEVPAHLYEAVAIVIAFVMRLPQTSLSTRSVRQVSVPESKLRDAPSGEEMAGASSV